MNKRTLGAASVIVALALAALTPAVTANAAEQTVSGAVTLAGVDQPGVHVGWFDPATGAGTQSVTAQNGSYSLTVATDHPFVLYAGTDHSDKQWKREGGDSYIAVFRGPTAPTVPVYMYQGLQTYPVLSSNLPGQNIELGLPGTITGQSLGLAGSYVDAQSLNGDFLASTRANDDGLFSFTGLTPGNYTVASTNTANGYDEYESQPISVHANATNAIQPSIAKLGEIRGTVKWHGKSVVDVPVSIIRDGGGWGEYVHTNSKGRFVLPSVRAGKYPITFGGSTKSGAISKSFYKTTRTATVVAGKTTTMKVSLTRGGIITGTVPKVGASTYFTVSVVGSKKVTVATHDYQYRTGKSFGFSGLKAGKYTAYIQNERRTLYASRTFTIRTGVKKSLGTVRLTNKSLTISGVVPGVESGYVEARTQQGQVVNAQINGGVYELKGMVPGSSDITVTAVSRVHSTQHVSYTKSSIRVLQPGAKMAPLTGQFLTSGQKIIFAAGYVRPAGTDERYGEGQFSVIDGQVSGEGVAGLAIVALDYQNNSESGEFVIGSPFWLDVPQDKRTVPLVAGQTYDFGTVALEVHR